MKHGWKRVSARLLLSFVSVVLTLVVLEWCIGHFRIFPHRSLESPAPHHALLHRRSQIPGLSYEMVPNVEMIVDGLQIKINSLGMRDSEPAPKNTSSLVRIVALGDSYTWGWRVPIEEAYPEVLEKLLNQSAGTTRYEVMNFGTIGYSTRDEVLVLRYKALAWNPDILILGYVFNDPETDPVQPLNYYFASQTWWERLELKRLVTRVKYKWDVKRMGGGDYYRSMHSDRSDKWRSVVRAFGEIRDLTSSRRIKVLVVIFPDVPRKGWGVYTNASIGRKVAGLAEANGFEALDLYDVFSHYGSRELRMSDEDFHPTPLGHRLAAQAIQEKLFGWQ